VIPEDNFPQRKEEGKEKPKKVMSLFELFLEPADEESLDADKDDTAVFEIDDLGEQIKETLRNKGQNKGE
jgi:hypothetical protein